MNSVTLVGLAPLLWAKRRWLSYFVSLECFWTCFQSHSRLAQGFVRQGWEAAAVGGFVSPGAELDMCTARVTHGCCGNNWWQVAPLAFQGGLKVQEVFLLREGHVVKLLEVTGFGGWLGRELRPTKCVCSS